MKGKIFLVALAVTICAYLSAFIADSVLGDFPAFYRTAKIALDPTTPITTIYSPDIPLDHYNIPDDLLSGTFVQWRYAVPVAYLAAPLGLLPYHTAKAVFIFTNMVLTLLSLAIILKLGGAKGRLLFYPLILSFLFLPFIHTIIFAQSNGILLFLVTLAVLAAVKNKPYSCGILLGTAVLIKAFPIAIAMALGIKNWRIFAASLIPVLITAILPGFKEWFISFSTLPFLPYFYSVPYRHLGAWFIAYILVLGMASAYFVYKNRQLKYEQITAFAIPAMFLAVPILEPCHLLLMFFPLGYILPSIKGLTSLAAILSVVFITAGSQYLPAPIYMLTSQLLFPGILLSLVAVIMRLLNIHPSLDHLHHPAIRR